MIVKFKRKPAFKGYFNTFMKKKGKNNDKKLSNFNYFHVRTYNTHYYAFYKVTVHVVILQTKTFLECDWLRPVVFKPNLKYLHVKITASHMLL